MMKNVSLSCAVLLLMACGGGGEEATETETTESGGGETTDSSGDTCLATMTRERECQAEFLPALVALRVRLDQPAGTAARDTAEGRDALVAEATSEYATDGTDENFARNCAQMAQLPEEQAAQWNGMMTECLATTDCAAFVECDMRFTEARFSGQ